MLVWHVTPDTAQPRRVSRVSMMDKATTDFFLVLTCGYACQKADGKDGHFRGDGEAAPRRHLGGAQLASVGDKVTALLPGLGARGGLIARCRQPPRGEPLQTGTGAPENTLNRFVAGPFSSSEQNQGGLRL